MTHPTSNLLIAKIALREPRDKADGVRKPTPYVKALRGGRAVTSEVLDGERTTQEDDSPSQNVPEPGVAVAADVDDAKTVGLEGKKASDYAIAADFVDAGT